MVRTGCVHYLFHFRGKESAFPTFFLNSRRWRNSSRKDEWVCWGHTLESHCVRTPALISVTVHFIVVVSASSLSQISDWSDRALHPPAVLWHRGGSVTTPLQRHGMNISFRDYRHALLPGASWESCALSGWLASSWIRPSLDFSVGWPMLSFQLGRGDNPPWQSLANMCKSAYQASGSPQLTKTENIHWQKSGHFLRLPCRECPEDLVLELLLLLELWVCAGVV